MILFFVVHVVFLCYGTVCHAFLARVSFKGKSLGIMITAASALSVVMSACKKLCGYNRQVLATACGALVCLATEDL